MTQRSDDLIAMQEALEILYSLPQVKYHEADLFRVRRFIVECDNQKADMYRAYKASKDCNEQLQKDFEEVKRVAEEERSLRLQKEQELDELRKEVKRLTDKEEATLEFVEEFQQKLFEEQVAGNQLEVERDIWRKECMELQPLKKPVVYEALRHYYKQGLFDSDDYEDLVDAKETAAEVQEDS